MVAGSTRSATAPAVSEYRTSWKLAFVDRSRYGSIMSTVQEIESAIQALPRQEIEALQDWIANFLEDELEFSDEFKAKIQRAEQEMSEGKGRVRNR